MWFYLIRHKIINVEIKLWTWTNTRSRKRTSTISLSLIWGKILLKRERKSDCWESEDPILWKWTNGRKKVSKLFSIRKRKSLRTNNNKRTLNKRSKRKKKEKRLFLRIHRFWAKLEKKVSLFVLFVTRKFNVWVTFLLLTDILTNVLRLQNDNLFDIFLFFYFTYFYCLDFGNILLWTEFFWRIISNLHRSSEAILQTFLAKDKIWIFYGIKLNSYQYNN